MIIKADKQKISGSRYYSTECWSDLWALFMTLEKRVEGKTGWPSGLRRQIKALVSSGAWVRIPLQSNIFLSSELCENGSEKAVEGSKVISGRGRLHSGLLRQRPWHDWRRRFWYYLCGSSHPPRARFCIYKTRLPAYFLHHQVPTQHLVSALF